MFVTSSKHLILISFSGQDKTEGVDKPRVVDDYSYHVATHQPFSLCLHKTVSEQQSAAFNFLMLLVESPRACNSVKNKNRYETEEQEHKDDSLRYLITQPVVPPTYSMRYATCVLTMSTKLNMLELLY